MLLSSKNDEVNSIKTFEVYSSYITLASNSFKQTKTLICVMAYIVEKVWLFEYYLFPWKNQFILEVLSMYFWEWHC